MKPDLERELERLTENAALRREDLLLSGLRKSRWRKALNIYAGLLALLSAGAITAVISNFFGEKILQLLAAGVAGLSGAITLFLSAYFGDDEVLNRFIGSSKYLALRESVFRLVINDKISDSARFEALSELQDEYARLDESYSRYFSLSQRRGSQSPPTLRDRRDGPRARVAINEDVMELQRKLRENKKG